MDEEMVGRAPGDEELGVGGESSQNNREVFVNRQQLRSGAEPVPAPDDIGGVGIQFVDGRDVVGSCCCADAICFSRCEPETIRPIWTP
jgi:hypothetical protein